MIKPRVNESKRDRLWSAKPKSKHYWKGHPEFGPIPPKVRQEMVRQEEKAQEALMNAIEERLQKLGL